MLVAIFLSVFEMNQLHPHPLSSSSSCLYVHLLIAHFAAANAAILAYCWGVCGRGGGRCSVQRPSHQTALNECGAGLGRIALEDATRPVIVINDCHVAVTEVQNVRCCGSSGRGCGGSGSIDAPV